MGRSHQSKVGSYAGNKGNKTYASGGRSGGNKQQTVDAAAGCRYGGDAADGVADLVSGNDPVFHNRISEADDPHPDQLIFDLIFHYFEIVNFGTIDPRHDHSGQSQIREQNRGTEEVADQVGDKLCPGTEYLIAGDKGLTHIRISSRAEH